MNEQMEQFKNVIEMAKVGDVGAVVILREICRDAADEAPTDDLVKMAQALYDIRKKAFHDHAEKN